jgi:hypothetical protein
MASFFLNPKVDKLYTHFTTHLSLFTIFTKRPPSQQPPNRVESGVLKEYKFSELHLNWNSNQFKNRKQYHKCSNSFSQISPKVRNAMEWWEMSGIMEEVNK